MKRPVIVPTPPVADTCALPWDAPTADPVAEIAAARGLLGDTFMVDSGEDRYLFTFSPVGVASFYALPEEHASKGVADWRMLRRKLPDDIFVGRRTLPHQLFGREDVTRFLANVERALDDTLQEGGEQGTVDVFALTRRLGHRVGLASWGGPGAASGPRFEALVTAFDTLDGSESFVHPDAMAAVAASGKAAEIAALATVAEHIGASLDELPGNEADYPLFTRLVAAWANVPRDTAAAGVAGDVALIHVASMSNLFAALGWALVDLIDHPAAATQVVAGDRNWAEACALESIRLAQRSIMARYVLAPISLNVGDAVYEVAPGATVATLLPLTNTSSAPGLEVWDPTRWKGRRLADSSTLEAVELVTSFGHGRHTCPAQPFSLAAMTTSMVRILSAWQCSPEWTDRPQPVQAQIGGVARSGSPCSVSYRRVTGPPAIGLHAGGPPAA
jgi:cytochrome P450